MKRRRLHFRMPGFNMQLFYSYISILLATLFLFAGVVYIGTSAMLKNRLVETSTETLRQTALNLEQYRNDVEQLMFNVSVNPTVQSALSNKAKKTDFEAVLEGEDIARQMISVDVFTQKTGGVYLFAEDQEQYPVFRSALTSPESGQIGRSAVFRADEVRQARWYQDAVAAHGKAVWEIPSQDDAQGGMFSANRSILDNKNLHRSLGVVHVLVPYSRLSGAQQDISFGVRGTVYLYAEGRLFGEGSAAERERVAQAIGQSRKSAAYLKIAGRRCCVLRCDIGNGWQMVGIMPEQTMLLRFHFVRNILLAALLFAVLLALLLTHLISQRMSRPIHQVASAMQHFEQQRAYRFPETRRDEIGVLYRSFNRMMNHIEMLLREIRETAGRQRRAELRALQAQINPHFLYNTLDCIKSLACLCENQEIVHLTTALSDFFRISLNKGAETLPLGRELQHVQSYCSIQNFRRRAAFSLEIAVPEALRTRTVIKLILQPLVENAVLHGIADRPGGVIRICAFEREDYLILEVRDNGAGADIEYLNGLISGEYDVPRGKSGGYGIKNVQERLHLTFGGASGLYYRENEGGGVVAEIRIAQQDGRERIQHGENEGAAGGG